MASENASADVLSQSNPQLFDYVRLYFRPKTPTFWNNEGIRPIGFRSMGAHCPMPIAFLFDATSVASMDRVQFSDGNLARASARRGDDASFLRTLEFQDIYHDGPMSTADRDRLRMRRQAEVIVPEKLALDTLRLIATRSDSERQTLGSLLEKASVSVPVKPEILVTNANLFNCQWSYVERVTLSDNRILFQFNPDSLTPGPFSASIAWANPETGYTSVTTHALRAIGNVSMPVPEDFRGSRVRIELYLDDSLAFSGMLEHVPAATLLR